MGLAFSGGGIRSATFGLGVLEALKKKGLLKQVDYLSTVSGGGYIGAWLSANCRRSADRREDHGKVNLDVRMDDETAAKLGALDWLDQNTKWDDSIRHLRRYSKYLSPEVGFFSADTWSMAMIWLRNTLLIQLTIVLAMALVLVLPRLLFIRFTTWPDVGQWRWITVLLFVLAVVGIAGNFRWIDKAHPSNFRPKKRWALIGVGFLTIAFVSMCGLPYEPFSKVIVPYSLREVLQITFLVALPIVLAGFFLVPWVIRPLTKLLEIFNVGLAALNKDFRNGLQPLNYSQQGVQVLVALPMLATGFLVGAILWGQSVSPHHPTSQIDTYGKMVREAWVYWPFPLTVAAASLWVLSFCSVGRLTESQSGQVDIPKLLVAIFSPLGAILVLHLLVCAIALLLNGWRADWPDWFFVPGSVTHFTA